MAKMRSLYKKDGAGKVRFWSVTAKKPGTLEQRFGVVHGSVTVREKECETKFKGQSNERSPIEQARILKDRRIKKKKEDGYVETLTEAQKQ